VLIARLERLMELADVTRVPDSPWLEAVTAQVAAGGEADQLLVGTVLTLMANCRGQLERAARALELIVQATSAESGFLFLVTDDALALAAPLHGDEPPEKLRSLLANFSQSIQGELTIGAHSASSLSGVTVADPLSSTYEMVPIVLDGSERALVGVAAVRAGAVSLTKPSPQLLASIARALYQAGDTVQPGRFSAR